MIDRTILPATPGALLGYWKDGRPFYVMAGGAPDPKDKNDGGQDQGDDDDGADGTGGDDGDSGQQDGRNGGRGGSGSRNRDQGGSGSGDDADGDDGSQGSNAIKAVRDEFKAERKRRQDAERRVADLEAAQQKLQQAVDSGNSNQQKIQDAIAKAFGLGGDDKPPTAEELAKKLDEATRQAADAVKAQQDAESRAASALSQARRERAVITAAPGLEANAAALLDSRSFEQALAKLDPDGDDFAADLEAAIKTAVDRNPAFKIGKPRRQPDQKSSGGDFGDGKPQDTRQWTDDDVDRATPAELEEAQEKGLLRDLGVGAPRRRRGARASARR